jgi:DNA polymerase III epsilon subunit family exonuclease
MSFSLIQHLREIPLVFIDVETNGLSARNGSRVIEMGVVRVVNGAVAGIYQQLIDPRRRISPKITAVTGITPAMCMGQPTFAQQCAAMLPHLRGAIVVGHNVQFDLSFICAEMVRARVPAFKELGKVPVLDTVRMARKRFGRGGNSLEVLSRRLGIEPDGAHRALADAMTTYKVFSELLAPVGGWEITLADAFLHQGGPMHLEEDEEAVETVGG